MEVLQADAAGQAVAGAAAFAPDEGVRRRFARACLDGWRFGWHEANGGNISLRLAPGRFLVSASGCFFRDFEDDFERCAGVIDVDDAGAWQARWGFAGGGRPTSELAAHLQAFRARPEAACVYHAHTPHAVALSHVLGPNAQAVNEALARTFTEFGFYLPQGVAVVPVLPPGSPQLAAATAQALAQAPVVLWQGHGVLSAAPSLNAAFGQVHVLEKTAQIYLEARALGATGLEVSQQCG